MTHRSYCNRRQPQPVNRLRVALWISLIAIVSVPRALAGTDAPQWMHSLVSVPLPAHDDKTDAVKLYSEINVSVQSEDKLKRTVRVAYKILRPSGRHFGEVVV